MARAIILAAHVACFISRAFGATSTCVPTTTSTVPFDQIPTGSPVPVNHGAPGLTWNNFLVVPASSYNITPVTPPNVAYIGDLGASLSYTSGSGYDQEGWLESFAFACETAIGGLAFGSSAVATPESCSLLLIAQDGNGFFKSFPVQTMGPYNYTACAKPPCPMKTVTLPGKFYLPEQLDFVMTAGPGFATILFDNFVIASKNNC